MNEYRRLGGWIITGEQPRLEAAINDFLELMEDDEIYPYNSIEEMTIKELIQFIKDNIEELKPFID